MANVKTTTTTTAYAVVLDLKSGETGTLNNRTYDNVKDARTAKRDFAGNWRMRRALGVEGISLARVTTTTTVERLTDED